MKSLNVSLLLTLILQVSHLPTLAADSESLPTVDHVFGVCALHKTIVVHAHGLADWAKTKSPSDLLVFLNGMALEERRHLHRLQVPGGIAASAGFRILLAL